MPKSSIINAIEAYEGESTSTGDLETERAQDLQYYQGILPKGNGLPDRSQVVSRDVSDAIERLKPAIIRVFCSGDDVCSFDPTGQEDIEGAQQETDYVNYIITQKNDWFTTAYQWFDDALIQKNGYVKAWYDESEDVNKETYKAQTDDSVAMLAQDPEVEIIELASYPNPMAVLMQPVIGPDGQPIVPLLYDVTLQRTKTYGCAKYVGIPPERTKVYRLHKDVSLEKCEFFEHWEDKSLSQLRLEGFDVDDDLSDEATMTGASETEENARNRFDEGVFDDRSNTIDPSMRKVRVRECWLRFDEDGDGKAELRHVIVVGVTELMNEECDMVPVAALTPRIWSHRHIGMAIADFARDIQDIKTQFNRGLIDNVNRTINERTAVNKNKVNIDDVLNNRPGGIVRVDGEPGANMLPMPHQANFAPLMGALQYFDGVLEERTGANRSSGQMNPDALSKLPSGIAISQILSASQAPVELISRVFAETGVKQLFRIIHALTLKNARKEEIVRLRNKWVVVDPRQWKKRSDMTISVGLGTGSKEQQLVALEKEMQTQIGLLPLQLTTPKTINHVHKKMVQAMGFKDVASFVPDEEGAQPAKPQQPPIDPLKVAELHLKDKTETGQLKVDAFNAETNRMKVQTDAKMGVVSLVHKAQQDNHGRTMDKANLSAAQKPGNEQAAMREESGNANQTILQAIAGADNAAQQRHEQLLQALMQLARPKSKVIVRDPKTNRATRADEVYTDTIQ